MEFVGVCSSDDSARSYGFCIELSIDSKFSFDGDPLFRKMRYGGFLFVVDLGTIASPDGANPSPI